MSAPTTATARDNTLGMLLAYFALGLAFGVILIKSEVASWYRIQEMFRFQAFHMYGVIMTAVIVAALSVKLIEWFGLRDARGRAIVIADKTLGRGIAYGVGGVLFGLGWGLAGVCPGPIFALLGMGVPGAVIVLLSALLGTWVFGQVSPRMPS